MIPLTRHTGHVLDTARRPILDPLAITLGMDESWSPRIQGEIRLHAADAAELAARSRVVVRLRAAFGPDLSIAALTEWWGGSLAALTARVAGSVSAVTRTHTSPWNRFEKLRPLAAFTGLWAGSVAAVTTAAAGTVALITQLMRQPGGTYDPPPPQLVEALVSVRPVASSQRSAEHRFQIAGLDIALHDFRRPAATVYTSTTTSLRALCGIVFEAAGLTLPTGPDTSILAGHEWRPGQTAWDYLHPVLEQAGWQLYANEVGEWVLAPRSVAPASTELHRDTNLIDWDTTTETPYNAAVIEYTGGDIPRYDVYAPTGARRVLREQRETIYPGPGAAQEIARRSVARANAATATATSLYELRPLQQIQATPEEGTVRDGTVEAVTWDYPDSTMRVILRDLT